MKALPRKHVEMTATEGLSEPRPLEFHSPLFSGQKSLLLRAEIFLKAKGMFLHGKARSCSIWP